MARSSSIAATLRAGLGRRVVDRLPAPLTERIRSAAGNGSRSAPSPGPRRQLLDDVLSDQLADVAAPVVVILGGKPGVLRGHLLAARPQAAVHRFVGLSASDLHVRLSALGPCDLLIDATKAPNRVRRIRNLIFHLRPGGVAVLFDLRDTPDVRFGKDLAALMADVGREWPRGTTGKASSDRARFGRAVRSFQLRGNHLVLVNGSPAQPKIREEQVAALLRVKPELGQVVAERPGAEQPFLGKLRMSEYDHLIPIVTGWAAPDLALRRYHDVLTSPGQVVTAGPIILPETFRHGAVPRLRNSYVAEIAPDFADTSEPAWFAERPEDGIRTLPGAYFYLDNEVRGHFGHMLTEVVSRLWAWDEAKAADPALKAIMHFNKHRDLASWEVQLLGAAGIPADDIVFSREPVRVEWLVSATPMLSNPAYIHPGIADVWRRIGDRLADQSTLTQTPKRIFIARRIQKRPCRNAPEVERFFQSLGFTIVFPEDHPLPDQIRMFREAELIAGFIGSGMFNLMFVPEPKKSILISSESYTGRNEILMAGVLGHELDIAWCRSEAEWSGDHFVSGYHAGFSFDFEREGVFVNDIVAEASR